VPGALAVTLTGPGVVDDVSVTAARPLVVFSEALEREPPVVVNANEVPSGTNPPEAAPVEFLVISAVMADVEVPLAMMLVGIALRLSTNHGL